MGDVIGGEVCRPFSPFGITHGSFIPERPKVEFEGRIWTWRLHMGKSLADLRTRIGEELDCDLTLSLPFIESRLHQLPAEARGNGWSLADGKHSRAVHARWLFLRLCPYPNRVLRPAEIADDHIEHTGDLVDESAVRHAVASLASAMRIDLPPATRGRPRADISLRRSSFL
ncbi:MAG TPA: hypothetical protein QGF05_11860 [Dehalococcoidia bacterium]|nr:hypothetical protein [Dehalococcoidia bacterium]